MAAHRFEAVELTGQFYVPAYYMIHYIELLCRVAGGENHLRRIGWGVIHGSGIGHGAMRVYDI